MFDSRLAKNVYLPLILCHTRRVTIAALVLHFSLFDFSVVYFVSCTSRTPETSPGKDTFVEDSQKMTRRKTWLLENEKDSLQGLEWHYTLSLFIVEWSIASRLLAVPS